MKKINNKNINTVEFWNDAYLPEKRDNYYRSVWTLEPSGRFPFLTKMIVDGDKVLDIGCGMGHFTRMVRENYPLCEIWGTDLSSLVIVDNAKDCPLNKYLVQKIGNQTELPDNYFDKVFCGEVIEHLDDPNLAFIDAYRVLKPGGFLIVTTPYRQEGEKSKDHMWSFDYSDIAELFDKHNFVHFQILHLPTDYSDRMIIATGVKNDTTA